MGEVYDRVLRFKKKYPMTVGWRLRKNSAIVEKHLNKGEKVLYAFYAQKNDNPIDMTSTAVIALTSKRVLIGRKRAFLGYFLDSITPDMFNDMNVKSGIFWGKIYIDTIKELVTLSNIQKKALNEIESKLTAYMLDARKKFPRHKKD